MSRLLQFSGTFFALAGRRRGVHLYVSLLDNAPNAKNSVKTHKFMNLCDFTEFLSLVKNEFQQNFSRSWVEDYQYQSSKLIGLISNSITRTLSKSVDCKNISGPNIYSKYWQGTASPLLWWGGRNWIIDKRTSRSLRVLSQYICPLVMKDFSRNRIHFEFIEAYWIYFCFKLS